MKKELRIHSVRVPLTATELAELERFAERERLKVSVVVRRVVLLAAEAAEKSILLESAKEA